MTLEERFLAKVCKTPGCWNWQGGKFGEGYGGFSICGRQVLAHRLSHELFIGPVPGGGLHVLHSCDNRLCVRPSHLRLGTNRENIQDAMDRGRWKSNRNAVLTEDDVRTIRARAAEGETQISISADYRVSQMMISYIVRRKHWAHVE